MLFVGGMVALGFHPRIRALATDRQQLAELIQSYGAYSALACIVIQVIQVVVFIIPGEVTQLAAGYVFGAWWGFALSMAGIMLGSLFNFYVVRLFGRPFVEKLFDPKTLAKVDAALEGNKGKTAFFLVFLLPGVPKDALSYAAGATALGYGEFLLLSGFGRVPALLFSVLVGARIAERNYPDIFFLCAVFALVFLIAYWIKLRHDAKHGKCEAGTD